MEIPQRNSQYYLGGLAMKTIFKTYNSDDISVSTTIMEADSILVIKNSGGALEGYRTYCAIHPQISNGDIIVIGANGSPDALDQQFIINLTHSTFDEMSIVS
jgi:hypothetical protein